MPARQLHVIEIVAADRLAGGAVSVHLVSRDRRPLGRQQMFLDLARLLQLLLHALLGHDLLEEPGVLDLHGRDIGQVGQEPQALLAEQRGPVAVVDVDQSDHVAVVPQGDAHDRSELLRLDAVSQAEAVIDQGVARQDRFLLAHHTVGDGLADRDGGAGLVGRDPYDLGLETLAVAQHEKTAFERHGAPG